MGATIIDRTNCRATRHGRYWMAAKFSCTCADTRAELRTRRHQARQGIPVGYLDATGTRRRLQALAVEGWSIPRLAELTGVSDRSLRYAINARTHVQTATARSVAAVYDRCAGHDGGNRAAASRALARGWHDSYAWPDHLIDNPQAGPWFGDDAAAVDHQERAATIARLTRAGETADNIAYRLGITSRSVQRHREAHRDNAA